MAFDLRCQQLSYNVQGKSLFSDTSFVVQAKDRIAIIGRNGAGKSTLLKIIEKIIKPDSGVIEQRKGLRIACLTQDVPTNLSGTLKEYYTDNTYYHDIAEHQIDRMIQNINLEPSLCLDQASGGQIRRILLGKTLLEDPDCILLDEPTNHMDIDTINWMENWLRKLNKTLIFITHDRQFMQSLATRIFQIDHGRIFCFDGSYNSFLQYMETESEALVKANALFDRKLAEEERWIRQGIKARRTRNEGRVRALKAMRQERANRHQQLGQMKVTQQKQAYAGKIAFEIDDVCYRTDNQSIIENFSCLIGQSDKIGIIGPNGCGKSTLFKLLCQQIQPESGTIKVRDPDKIAYFDQHRDTLNDQQTLIENVAEGRTHIHINGKDKHIISYLQDFLFTPEQSRRQIGALSGGEKNRLLLAKLLSKPKSVLILDEPSNDLDIETLQLLEEFLVNYDGTVLMASHDRQLLNNVVTSLIVFEGDGRLIEHVGDYDSWIESQENKTKNSTNESDINKTAPGLTYKERKLLNKLPKQIQSMESELDKLHQHMSTPSFYQSPADEIEIATAKAKALEEKISAAYDTWSSLEEKESN